MVDFHVTGILINECGKDENGIITLNKDPVVSLYIKALHENHTMKWFLARIPSFVVEDDSGTSINYGIISQFLEMNKTASNADAAQVVFDKQELIRRLVMLNGFNNLLLQSLGGDQYRVTVLQDKEGRAVVENVTLLLDMSGSMKPVRTELADRTRDLLLSLKEKGLACVRVVLFDTPAQNAISKEVQLNESSIPEFFQCLGAYEMCRGTDLSIFAKEIVGDGVLIGFTDGEHTFGSVKDIMISVEKLRRSDEELKNCFVFKLGEKASDFLDQFSAAMGGRSATVQTLKDLYDGMSDQSLLKETIRWTLLKALKGEVIILRKPATMGADTIDLEEGDTLTIYPS